MSYYVFIYEQLKYDFIKKLSLLGLSVMGFVELGSFNDIFI
jgi:hypothetical protein